MHRDVHISIDEHTVQTSARTYLCLIVHCHDDLHHECVAPLDHEVEQAEDGLHVYGRVTAFHNQGVGDGKEAKRNDGEGTHEVPAGMY